MKKKLILFSSIFALVLSFVFLIPSNKVHASEVEYTEEDYNNFIEPLWELYDEEFHDYYNSYYKYYHDDPIAFIEDCDSSFNDEVYQFAAYVGMFYYINEDLNFSKFPFFMNLYGDEDWIEITTFAGHFDAINCIYSEIGFSSNEYIGAQYEVLYSYAEVKAEINSLIGFENGFNAGVNEIEEKYRDYELKSILGPFYKGVYFGYINKDLTMDSNSVPVEFLAEYNVNNSLLNGRYFDINYICQDIYRDLADAILQPTSTTSFTIYFVPENPIKINDLDFSVKGVNGIKLLDENNSIYYESVLAHVTSFNNFTFKDVSSDVFIGAIVLTISDYSEFVKNDGFFRYNGFDSIYYEGFDKGYVNGSSLSQDKYDEGYDLGHEEGYDKGYDDAYRVGYNEGILEKNPVTLKTLFWTIAGLPFETFKHIVNFDFLGYNVASVFTGLVTSLCVIWVVKRFFL